MTRVECECGEAFETFRDELIIDERHNGHKIKMKVDAPNLDTVTWFGTNPPLIITLNNPLVMIEEAPILCQKPTTHAPDCECGTL